MFLHLECQILGKYEKVGQDQTLQVKRVLWVTTQPIYNLLPTYQLLYHIAGPQIEVLAIWNMNYLVFTSYINIIKQTYHISIFPK